MIYWFYKVCKESKGLILFYDLHGFLLYAVSAV